MATGCFSNFGESKDSNGFLKDIKEGDVSSLYNFEEVLSFFLKFLLWFLVHTCFDDDNKYKIFLQNGINN